MRSQSDKQLIKIFRDWNGPPEFDEKGRLYLPCPMEDWDFKPVVPDNGMHGLVGSGFQKDGEYSLECIIEQEFGIWRARPVDPVRARLWAAERRVA